MGEEGDDFQKLMQAGFGGGWCRRRESGFGGGELVVGVEEGGAGFLGIDGRGSRARIIVGLPNCGF